MASEFELIDLIHRLAGKGQGDVLQGIGDDAALMQLPGDCALVASSDTLNAGVHFSPDAPPFDLGHKSLAVNLSDLAAMGATPRWVLLSISLPEPDVGWLEQFVQGFLSLAGKHAVQLVGGDTCAGPLSITVTALGSVRRGQALLRSTAKAGDLIVVSGALGAAGLALRKLQSSQQPTSQELHALLRPEPRVALGQALVGKATACIDLSDGLLADLGHIAERSGCQARVQLEALPAAESLKALAASERWELQLGAGDDYELCFTWPAMRVAELDDVGRMTGVGLSVIGVMEQGSGVRCLTPAGKPFESALKGHEHFK